MDLADFDYELPPSRIAAHPPEKRGDARMLTLSLDDGACADRRFEDLREFLRPGDLLVLNDTRVVPARLRLRKPGGGGSEFLLERALNEHQAWATLRGVGDRVGMRLEVIGADGEPVGVGVEVEERGEFHRVRFIGAGVDETLNAHGLTPLPPYLRREPQAGDRERYQTVYARVDGAVAAPTAGLHFEEPMLEKIAAAGVVVGYLTLHVGAGTFLPLRPRNLRRGELHSERFAVSEALCAQVAACRAAGGRVVAVGTTTCRALESVAADGAARAGEGETRLFIRPGYEFQVVDALLTNFHLPRSSLLLLVCALAGREAVLRAYAEAVRLGYRFHTYGDAMLIAPAI